ncbi:MAG TPA: amidohydrolase [Armatimonadota bacterium]|jgi:amidohydrolase
MGLPDFRSLKPELVRLRRDLHRHPELAFQEERTSRVVADYLGELGIPAARGIAGTGVVGLIEGAKPGPVLLIRADMDALPITEANDHGFCSENPGVMHACGHDGHTAIALVVAQCLHGLRDRLSGQVKMVFQPAEEGPGGARPMIEAGVLENPTVDAALGLHLWNDLPIGTLGVRDGPLLASTDRIEIRLRGKGGHAASPHQAIDPIVAGAHLVTALQTVVSRSLDPLQAAVVSITQFHAGTTDNVIPGEATLVGTMRSFVPSVRTMLAERVGAMVAQVSSAFQVEGEFLYTPNYPPTVSDPQMCNLVREAAGQVVGESAVVVPGMTMGGEDMAFFLEKVPGCFFCVGSSNEAEGKTHAHHNPRFDFDEEALVVGTEVMVRSALAFLS